MDYHASRMEEQFPDMTKLTNILQPPGISREDGERVHGMMLIPWNHGKSLLWDVRKRKD